MNTPCIDVEIFLIGSIPGRNTEAAFTSEYPLSQELQEIGPVAAVSHRTPDLFHFCSRDVARSIRNFFRTRHHQPLPLLNRLNIKCSIHQRLVSTRVQPSHSTSHDHNFQFALL